MNDLHKIGFRQCPGYPEYLVQAVCSCGWLGRVRNMNVSRDRVLLKFDQNDHFNPDGSVR